MITDLSYCIFWTFQKLPQIYTSEPTLECDTVDYVLNVQRHFLSFECWKSYAYSSGLPEIITGRIAKKGLSQKLHDVPTAFGNLVYLGQYNDVIMGETASQITGVSIVCSTVGSGGDHRKYQSSASLAFVWGTHRRPVNSPHKRPVRRKMFPFDDVIMIHSYVCIYRVVSPQQCIPQALCTWFALRRVCLWFDTGNLPISFRTTSPNRAAIWLPRCRPGARLTKT